MNTKPLAVLLATLALAVPSLAAGGALSDALSAFRAGEYKRTLELLGEVEPGSEDHSRAQYLVGETQLVLGDAKAAEASFRGVVAARPEAVPALVGLGRALILGGALEEAEKPLARALALEPGDLAAKRAKGELLMFTQRLPEARELLIEVFERNPKDPMSARSLVDVLIRMEVAPDAMRVAEDFAIVREEHPMGYFLRGLVHEQLEQDDAAIRSYQLALTRDAKFLDAHKNLGILCHTLSDTYKLVERNRLAMRHYAIYFELGGKDDALATAFERMKAFLTPEGELVTPPAQSG